MLLSEITEKKSMVSRALTVMHVHKMEVMTQLVVRAMTGFIELELYIILR